MTHYQSEDPASSCKKNTNSATISKRDEKALEPAEKRTEKKPSSLTKHLSWLILIIAFAASCMGLFIKFSQDKAFVNQQLTTIAQSNQEALDDINKRLDSIEKEITAITPVLEDAGANFDSSSSATKKSMEKEIKALDNQLTDLKKTIELLKESKGIY